MSETKRLGTLEAAELARACDDAKMTASSWRWRSFYESLADAFRGLGDTVHDLELENARLRGENDALRSLRKEPADA